MEGRIVGGGERRLSVEGGDFWALHAAGTTALALFICSSARNVISALWSDAGIP